MRKLLLILLLLFSISAVTLAEEWLEVEGRTYRLYVPENLDESQPVPLWIALHAASSSAKAMAVQTDFDQSADEGGFIVAYPQSDGITWNEGRADVGTHADDMSFLTDMLASIQAEHNIDPEQISVAGFANGGMMGFRLACDMADVFDTIVVVSAMMWQHHDSNCPSETTGSVNLVVFHGTNDPFYRSETFEYTTAFNNSGPTIYGVDDMLGFWAERQNCTEIDATLNQVREFLCEEGSRLAYYAMQNTSENWLRTGDFQLNQRGLDLTPMILDFANDAENWAVEQEIVGDDLARSYTLYVPSTYDATQATPVVVVLHGRYGTGAGTARLTEFNDLAEKEGFIALYPDGMINPGSGAPYDFGWHYLRGVPYFDTPEEPDDTAFIVNLLADLGQDLNIDSERVFATGISNGGFMVHRLACEAPEVFAGFASVAGAGFGGMDTVCTEGTPVHMMIIHGTHDNNIMWNGNPMNLPGGEVFYNTWPIADSGGFWANRIPCPNEAQRVDMPESGNSPGTSIRILSIDNCDGSASVVMVIVLGGGHNWPGMPGKISSAVAGNVNQDINATVEIWEYFKRISGLAENPTD